MMLIWKRIFLILCMLSPIVAYAADPIEIEYEVQRTDVRYRLFKTRNTWNFLELDTQTGQVWQVQFSVKEDVSRFRVPIIKDALVTPPSKTGRFTLYPTKNIYNYILLDQDQGKAWQVQWAIEGEPGFWSIDIPAAKSEWKR